MIKMKRIFGLFMVVTMVSSCSEDFLERSPLDEIAPVDFFITASDLQLYANRFYPLLPSHSGYGGGTFWIDRNSDNLVPYQEDPRLAGLRTIPATGAGWEWNDIRQANYFLDHCYFSPAEAAQKKVYIAEVRFFKAFLYFEKVKAFGDVPWFTHALDTESPELYAARDRRDVVIDSVIACLDSAILHLQPASDATPFRLNRETAMLFKARVCLYEGTWEKYHMNTPFGVPGRDGTEYLELAAETAGQLMDLNTLDLYIGPAGSEYFSLFNQLDYTGNPEVLLWKRYDIGLGLFHYCSQYLPFGGGDIGVSGSFMDDYLCTDGMPISVSPLFQGYDSLELEASNRDPRLAQSILLPGADVTINSPGGSSDRKFTRPPIDVSGQYRSTTGYGMYKGANLEFSQQLSSGGTMACIFFRYAEALLVYAEARAELGTITQQDLDNTINRLRGRVGMIPMELDNITTDPDWDFPSLAPVINEIRRERRIELAFEGHRWDDLARWRAHELIAGKRPRGILYIGSNLEDTYYDFLGNPTVVIGHNVFVDEEGFLDPYREKFPGGLGFDPERDYLSPIPSDEITLNDHLVQNPGW
jgi:starch-binding outer membrane protein, SusD/RagB family